MSEGTDLLAELRDRFKEKPDMLKFFDQYQEKIESALTKMFSHPENDRERSVGLAELRSLFGVGDQKIMHPLDESELFDVIAEIRQRRNSEQAETHLGKKA